MQDVLPLEHLRGRTAFEPEQQAAEILVRRELGLHGLADLLSSRARRSRSQTAAGSPPSCAATRSSRTASPAADDKLEAAVRWELEDLVFA
jgi:hypothetical protein